MKLVIKGVFYYDRESDTILVPHFTGEYSVVDCDRYLTMDELKDRYDENYINQVKDNPMHFEGKDYYDAEYSPYDVGDWELLSDLSELSFMEENFDW